MNNVFGKLTESMQAPLIIGKRLTPERCFSPHEMVQMNQASFERSLRQATSGQSSEQLKSFGETTAKLAKVILCHPDHLQGFISRTLPFSIIRSERNNRNSEAKQQAYDNHKRLGKVVGIMRRGRMEYA